MIKNIMAEIIALPYRIMLKRLGNRPRLYPRMIVSGARWISLGNNVRVEAFASLSAISGGRLEIGSSCEIRSFALLEADSGHLVLGDRTSVNHFCLLNGYGGLRIGNDVRIASHTVILSTSHKYADTSCPISTQGMTNLPTTIGDDVWIGSHCVILGGVSIGSHSIVAAGSVVREDVPSFSVVGGVPAKILSFREMK
jgi:acetyltransferase-like isoleucine patch superfamily enzyme